MIKTDKILIFGLILLIIMLVFSLFVTFPAISKATDRCKDGIELTTKCGCFPDKNMAEYFGAKDYYEINLSEGINYES